MEEREMLVLSEKKDKINKIKEKYKNLEMSDETASKVGKLEVLNKVLKGALIISGITTVIDIIIPDPVLGIDEALLTLITGTLKLSQSFVDKHIKDLVEEEKTNVTAEEVTSLTNNLAHIVSHIKSNKSDTKSL